jgi:hypothetical protein
MGITDFHYLLVFQDRVAAVCTLDQRLDYEEAIPLVRPSSQSPGLLLTSRRNRQNVYSDWYRMS